MKRPPFKVKLFVKTTRTKSDGTAPVFARVRVNLTKMELATSQYILPEHWDDSNEVVITSENADTINLHLQSFKAQIFEAHSQLFIARQEITMEGIKAILLGKSAVKEHT